MGEHIILQGDVLEQCKTLPDNSIDAVFCDPPYGLSFMGKTWDYNVPSVATWAEIVRVLKPGGHVLSFGGSRTYHRMVCAMEDAGLEIRDQLSYLYGSGFPKSARADLAVDKALGATHTTIGERELTGNAGLSTADKGGTYGVSVGSAGTVKVPVKAASTPEGQAFTGYGTALKPAHEPICLARKPLIGTIGANALQHGTGVLNIDGCRIGRDPSDVSGWSVSGSEASDNVAMSGPNTPRPPKVDADARWPANVLLDEESAAHMDAIVGPLRPSEPRSVPNSGGVSPCNVDNSPSRKEKGYRKGYGGGMGGPSRFFYTSKVSTRERNAGCDHLPLRSAGAVTDRDDDSDGLNSPRAGAGRTGGARNHHPTLKPLDLTQHLATLLLPPNRGEARTILVPFSGAGSEMIGALRAGWDAVIGIELDPAYAEIAEARIAHWTKD